MKLYEIRKLIDEATPGPWQVEHPGHGERCEPAHLSMVGEGGRHQIIVDHRRDYSDPAPDGRFIAAARTLLPALLKVAQWADDARDIYKSGEFPGWQLAHLEEALAALEALKLP